MSTPPRAEARPLSPHLQVWRWHVTMATSILHRASGVALAGGGALLAAWLVLIAAGPDAYGPMGGLLASIFGQAALFLLTMAFAYHLANGVRHLFWDLGHGYTPKVADASGWAVIVFALIAPIAVFALATF